jgi:antitoxin component HigA of HigAB toxin-antitoxin module
MHIPRLLPTPGSETRHLIPASNLCRLLGGHSLGPKILGRQRALSKAHIKTLAKHFKVSPAVLLD